MQVICLATNFKRKTECKYSLNEDAGTAGMIRTGCKSRVKKRWVCGCLQVKDGPPGAAESCRELPTTFNSIEKEAIRTPLQLFHAINTIGRLYRPYTILRLKKSPKIYKPLFRHSYAVAKNKKGKVQVCRLE